MFEYVKPQAEIIEFLARERLATEEGDSIQLPGYMPSMSEGVEDWEKL